MDDNRGNNSEREIGVYEATQRYVKSAVLKEFADGLKPLSQIVSSISSRVPCSRHEVIKALKEMETDGEIRISEESACHSLQEYSFSPASNWFWISIMTTILSLLLIFGTSGFAMYFRYFFGSLLIFFLPGYSVIEMLYSRREEASFETAASKLARTLALSVGVSLAILPSVAIVLNYSVGITVLPLAVSLAGITALCLFVALKRKYSQYRLIRTLSD